MDFREHQQTWEELGRRDPMWAILSDRSKQGGGWDPEDFFRRGRSAIAWIARHLERVGCLPAGRQRALDFGCGLGRLTQPLCDYFREVVGVDIAESMVEAARRHNRHGERCRYVVNARPDLRQFESERFDFVLSLIVLQHMRPELAEDYLRELVRLLRPGGVLFFQVADTHRDPDFEPAYAQGSIAMYGVPELRVRQLLEAAGVEVADVAEDDWAGANWSSRHYTVRKP